MELPGEDRGGDPSPRPGMRERERENSYHKDHARRKKINLENKARIGEWK